MYTSEKYFKSLLEAPWWEMKDPHDILGVNKGATEEEIKKAYRDAAKKYHPDRFASADPETKKKMAEKFAAANWAKERIDSDKGRGKFKGRKGQGTHGSYSGGTGSRYQSWADEWARKRGFRNAHDMNNAWSRGFYSSKQWQEAQRMGTYRYSEYLFKKFRAKINTRQGKLTLAAVLGVSAGLVAWKIIRDNKEREKEAERFKAQKAEMKKKEQKMKKAA